MQGIQQKICYILQKHFIITFEKKNPQYLFYSVFGSEHIKYDCVRIFYTGENITPNFNICDYAIGFDHISFLDRYLRYPLYLFYEQDTAKAMNKHNNIDLSILQSKTRFCNFIVSNGNADPVRESVFRALSAFKKVDSGGKYLNNIGSPIADKFAFQSECRFSLCFENSSTPGYVTEKLIQAAAAQTIPIYWGDTQADKEICNGGGGINKKAIINAHNFPTIESLIAHIKTIESDTNTQLAILKEPLFLDPNHIEYFESKLQDFLLHIFNQSYEKSFRRGRACLRLFEEQNYKRYMAILAIFKQAKSILKYCKTKLEHIKQHL